MTICIIALLDLANVLEKPSSGSRSVQNGPKARQGFDPLTNSSFMAKTFSTRGFKIYGKNCGRLALFSITTLDQNWLKSVYLHQHLHLYISTSPSPSELVQTYLDQNTGSMGKQKWVPQKRRIFVSFSRLHSKLFFILRLGIQAVGIPLRNSKMDF